MSGSLRDPSRPTRILLADDHRLFREGVSSLLQRSPDLELVGEAATGEEAVRLSEQISPDVVLMDLNMPGMSGIEATRRIRQRQPAVGIIVLTMLEDDASLFAALQAGATGYVLKDAERGDLVRAIRAVAHGEALLGHRVAQRVLDQVSKGAAGGTRPRAVPSPRDLPPPFDTLTRRELDVLVLITAGRRNAEIAEALFVTEKTVGNHISSIFSKLHVRDRVEAILRAKEAGVGSSGGG